MSHCSIAGVSRAFWAEARALDGLYISYTDRLRNGLFDSKVWDDGLHGGGGVIKERDSGDCSCHTGRGGGEGPLNVLLIEFGSYSM